MALSRLEIKGNSANIWGLEILLDGHPVPGLRDLQLVLTRDDANEVYLFVNIDSVDIDTEALVILEALHDREWEESTM